MFRRFVSVTMLRSSLPAVARRRRTGEAHGRSWHEIVVASSVAAKRWSRASPTAYSLSIAAWFSSASPSSTSRTLSRGPGWTLTLCDVTSGLCVGVHPHTTSGLDRSSGVQGLFVGWWWFCGLGVWWRFEDRCCVCSFISVSCRYCVGIVEQLYAHRQYLLLSVTARWTKRLGCSVINLHFIFSLPVKKTLRCCHSFTMAPEIVSKSLLWTSWTQVMCCSSLSINDH